MELTGWKASHHLQWISERAQKRCRINKLRAAVASHVNEQAFRKQMTEGSGANVLNLET